MFVKADFVYDAEADLYRFPAGQALTYRFSREENGLVLRRPRAGRVAAGPRCALRARTAVSAPS